MGILPARLAARLLACLALLASAAAAAQPGEERLKRGEYLLHAAGCTGCHTDPATKEQRLAGGRALKTAFGTFYAPNITPDRETGIGGWSDEDFLVALRRGVGPDGSHYYPSFPYPAFTQMTDEDILDLKAYLFTRPPLRRENRAHELKFPFGFRPLLWFWKLLYFEEGPLRPDPARPAEINRGDYIANALAHCGACHTPRGPLGSPDLSKRFAGTTVGPTGGSVPNITPDRETGLGKWSDGDYDSLLSLGMLPDGDFVGAEMAEVVDDGTSKLTAEDRAALIVYLRALPPVRNVVERKKPD